MGDKPENYLSRAARYRAESAKCRSLAKQAGVENIRREYEKLADIYARLANDAEQMHALIMRQNSVKQT